MLSKNFKLLSLLFVLTMITLFVMTGCASFLAHTIKNTAGPSNPSHYYLSIDADPIELPWAAGQTEITVKVWDSKGKPVPGVSVNLYPKSPHAGYLHEDIIVTNNEGIAKTILKDNSLYGGSQYVEAKLEDLRTLIYLLFKPDGGPGIQNP